MPRPRHAPVPLDAEATTTRTEGGVPEIRETPVPAVPSPLAAVQPEPVPEGPQRSPARQNLADAIADREALAREVADHEAAVSEKRAVRDAAVTAYYKAESDLERAMPGFRPSGPHFSAGPEEVEAFHAWLNTEPLSIGDARAALAVAKDAKDSATTAVEYHGGRLDDLRRRQQYRSSHVDDAISAVIAVDPALAALMAEARRIALAYRDVRHVVGLIEGRGSLSREHDRWDRGLSAPDAMTSPISALWGDALERLKTDPDAPLPAV